MTNRFSCFYPIVRTAATVFMAIAASSVPLTAQETPAECAVRVISPDMMRTTIGFLASDELLGRFTPGPGLDSAAAYIAARFREEGLRPLGESWFQDLDDCYLDLGNDNLMALVEGARTEYFATGIDYIPYNFSGSRGAEGDIVFAGYGITAPEYKYDDYKGLDVKGKIVVILRQEPGQTGPVNAPFKGVEMTPYSGLNVKQEIAAAHGAIGLVVLSGPLQYSSMHAVGSPWPALSVPSSRNGMMLIGCDETETGLPMVHGGEAVVRALFGCTDSLLKIQQRMESTLKPHSFPFIGKAMALNVSFIHKPLGGRNVVAFIEGSDPILKKEAVIIGGHYDHIGYRREAPPGSDSIYNGADDNASGTAGMLAVARGFASMTRQPKRSVIFIAFAGEERGLLGSRTWVRLPRWPLEKSVAMLNLDMISRNHPDSLYLMGARQNPGLMKVIRRANRITGLSLEPSRSRWLPGGSDHASFFRAGVPALFFFTGLHEDYHSAEDEADRTDAVKAARVARLAFLTAWQIAAEGERYATRKPSVRKD